MVGERDDIWMGADHVWFLGVNIVTGWQAAEYEQMNLWPGNKYFGYRYIPQKSPQISKTPLLPSNKHFKIQTPIKPILHNIITQEEAVSLRG